MTRNRLWENGVVYSKWFAGGSTKLTPWHIAVAPPGGKGGSFPLWVDVQKLCNMCVLSLSWNFFVSHDKYITRPSSKEPRWYTDNTTGTGGLRTLDPPVTKSWRRHWHIIKLSRRSATNRGRNRMSMSLWYLVWSVRSHHPVRCSTLAEYCDDHICLSLCLSPYLTHIRPSSIFCCGSHSVEQSSCRIQRPDNQRCLLPTAFKDSSVCTTASAP